jgi:photosystem II stability/assembly factor-like uncharacterized protein
MDRHPGADLMKSFAGFAVLLLLLTSCAASSATPAEQQSTAGHIVTTATGSRGSVFFVSDQVGWVFTIPPDGLRTVVFRTGDGGRHWRVWGIVPTLASALLGFSANEVVLQGHGCPAHCDQVGMVRSGDGAHWSFATTPTGDLPFFLPDLQHGWVFGFVPEPPCDACLPQGKGGPPAPPSPSALWYTADGGVSWRMQMKGNFGDAGGSPTFWNTDDGLLVQPPAGGGSAEVMWSTHDGGVTWHRLTFSFPPPLSSQAFVTASQLTIFDQARGLLALRAADYHPQTTLYVSETSDAGKTWSTPRDMTSCLECSGQVFYLDSRHWLAYDKSFFITSDAGATWHPTAPTITAKNMSAVEVLRLAPGTAIALEPGVIASMTTDWGAHWRAVGLPQIYQSYRGFNGSGGSPFCCI